ncbi:MlaE family ABC transporter permease [Sulfurospirillum sp. 1612]|uniref:MlaE family ABC transporter permease n=1 Tax=Sulfurospirillum sp. 1612 TaxID=3094835 RepID=UPI002F95F2CF
MFRFFENIGDVVVDNVKHFIDLYKFSIICFFHIFNPKSYNPASKKILIEEIYYTSIQVLPVFLLSAIIFGALFMGFIVDLSLRYGLQNSLSTIIVKFIIVEFVPFFMALFISLRTGLRVGIKIARMRVNNEFNSLKRYKIHDMNYQFTPRAIASMISFLSLAILFSVIMILSGYVFMFFSINMKFDTFIAMLVKVVSIKDIVLFTLKCLFFGFIIIVIPSFSGSIIKKRYIEIPLFISKTMMVLFVFIVVTEVISLTIQYL